MVITRWASKTYWGNVDATTQEYNGVAFKDRACVECQIRSEIVDHLSSKGHVLNELDFYKYSLTKTVNKKAQYNIILYVAKSEFYTDDCPEAKEYLRKIMAKSIVVKQ